MHWYIREFIVIDEDVHYQCGGGVEREDKHVLVQHDDVLVLGVLLGQAKSKIVGLRTVGKTDVNGLVCWCVSRAALWHVGVLDYDLII